MNPRDIHDPLISIIIATRNCNATLQTCLDSIKCQTYAHWEVIVIDACSRDGTVNTIQNNGTTISHWISEPDKGIFSAWNKGLEFAQGEWVCFLGADDYLFSDRSLSEVVRNLKAIPQQCNIAYARIALIDASGDFVREIGDPWAEAKSQFMMDMCIPHVGLMHRRTLFSTHGKFDESYKIAGDYEFLLRELKTSDAFFLPDVVVAAQRMGGVSTQEGNLLSTRIEVFRAKRAHGLPVSWITLLGVAVDTYLKKIAVGVLGDKLYQKLRSSIHHNRQMH